MEEKQISENLRKCPSFQGCSKNICPLDWDIESRSGVSSDKCRWMREESRGKIEGKEIVFGGKQIPDKVLKFVPEKNIKYLNEVSIKRCKELNLR